MREKIENIEKVFIVVKRSVRIVKPEIITLTFYGDANLYAVFPNRKNAEKWVNYWNKGGEVYDILERKLT